MTRQTFAVFLSISLCCVIFSVGCSKGRAKPKDLPPLFSCTITFTQEGVPLDNANIVLHSSGKWSAGGMTNKKGEVSLATGGFFDGIPEGTYKITVTKTITDVDSNGNILKITDVIPNQFKKEGTTPLDIEIGKSNNNKTFDLGKAVSIKLSAPK